MNLVEKANKVMTFRKGIRAKCQKIGIEYPSDDRISEYINNGLGLDVDKFMEEYTRKQDPMADFVKAARELMPMCDAECTTEIATEFVSRNGYNVKAFVTEVARNRFKGVRRATLDEFLELGWEIIANFVRKVLETFNDELENRTFIYDIKNDEDMASFQKICDIWHYDTRKIMEDINANSGRFIRIEIDSDYISIFKTWKEMLIHNWDDIFNTALMGRMQFGWGDKAAGKFFSTIVTKS